MSSWELVIAGVLVAELKALPEIATVHVGQALSYLKAPGGIRRVVRTRQPILLARILASWRLGGSPMPGSPTTYVDYTEDTP